MSNQSFFDYNAGPVYYDVFSTSMGDIMLQVTEEGVCGCHFLVDNIYFYLAVSQKHFGQIPQHCCELPQKWFDQLMHSPSSVPFVVRSTSFQRSVWEAILQIPRGKTVSYETLAQLLHMPESICSISRSLAKNFIAYFIPCHRVVYKSGKLGPYRWGAAKKQMLLQQEQEDLAMLHIPACSV